MAAAGQSQIDLSTTPPELTPGGLREVSPKTPAGETIHILAVDCGIKSNIIRYLVCVLRVKLTVVPWDYDFTKEEFDGLFLSNGPGDPTMVKASACVGLCPCRADCTGIHGQ